MNRQWQGREAELNRRLREASDAGHGVLTLDDLSRLGVSEDMIRSRRQSGRLVPVLRAVVALPGTRLNQRGRYRAAVHAGGKGCCLAHRSALALHGLVPERGPVHIVRTSGPGSGLKRSETFGFSVQCHQTAHLPDEHITVIEGIRTVTPERALLGFASEATDTEIGKALSQGERERILCWATLNEMVAGTNGVKGLGRLRDAIRGWTPAYADAKSDPEEDFLRMIVRGRLPVPEVNQPIGNVVPDFLWRHLRLVVELDPYGTHKGYESFHRDRRKSVFLEQMGLRVIRFTWVDRYNHPERTVSELRRIMNQQARLHGTTLFREERPVSCGTSAG